MTTGSALFYELESLPETLVVPKISLGSVLYKRRYQQSRQMSFDEIGRLTAAHINHYVYLTDKAIQFVETMGLNKEETKLVKIIAAKPYRLREIFSMSPLLEAKHRPSSMPLIPLIFWNTPKLRVGCAQENNLKSACAI